jgi:hypothetical protein
METHLSFLEDESRKKGDSSRDPARSASEKFGNAVDHFRAALEDMTGRQRALRQLLIAAIAASVVTVVAGVVATVLILRSLDAELSSLRAEILASSTELNQANVTCAVLVAEWSDPPGRPNSLHMPVTLDAWKGWVASTGLDCGVDEAPGFMWKSQGWVAKGYNIPEGVSIWFSLDRMQQMTPDMAVTAATAFKAVTSEAQSARCVPRSVRTNAGL